MALEIYTIDGLSNTKCCYLLLKKAKVTFHITIKVCYQLPPVHYKQDGTLEFLKECCVGGETFKRRLAYSAVAIISGLKQLKLLLKSIE